MKHIAIALVRLYRKFISPILPDSCRFTPSCSQYAIEAIDKFGAIRGTILATYRILRCNPFCRGGYDPVPDKFTFKRQELKYDDTVEEEETGEENV